MLNTTTRSIRYATFMLGAILVLAAMATATPAYALRCNRNVISEGNLTIEVLRHCGEPIQVEEWWETRPQQLYDYDLGYYIQQPLGKPVHMEEWIYNFGPRRLMRKLTFRDTELIKIESLGYGY